MAKMTNSSGNPNLPILKYLHRQRATLHSEFYHSIGEHDQDFESHQHPGKVECTNRSYLGYDFR